LRLRKAGADVGNEALLARVITETPTTGTLSLFSFAGKCISAAIENDRTKRDFENAPLIARR
jgi:hypothetical protein